MKIALLAPFEEIVPPRKYGGTELVVHTLAEEFVKLGHNVTLFASGDSTTSARLIACVDKAIRPYLEINPRTWFALQLQGLHRVMRVLKQEQFDIVHNHLDWPFLLLRDLVSHPVVTTLHNPIEQTVKDIYDHNPFISISNAQRRGAPTLHYVATVHNGIEVDSFDFNDTPKDYLAFLGRITPDKGPEQTIKIAKKANRRLIMAAKIDPPDRKYFKNVIKPLIDGEQIRFIGEVDHAAKNQLLKNAAALLSPIQWDEPFGVTNIEAMACGTPVIATNRGSLPEIIKDGKVGFLCKDVAEMIKRVKDVPTINRQACRQHVEQNFTANHMAKGYLAAYEKVMTNPMTKPRRA